MRWLLLLLFIPSAFGLGISPAQITMTEPGEFSFRAIAEDEIAVRAEGSMAEFIELTIAGDTISGRLTSIPDLGPGDHHQRIILAEAGEAGTVSVRQEVAGLLIVRIPQDGPYLEGDLHVSHDESGGQTLATLMLENIGNEQTTPDSITLDIGTTRFRMEPQRIPPLGTAKHQERFSLVTVNGVYDATATITYGNRELILARQFTKGSPVLMIDSIVYNEEEGDIIPLDVSGRISWNAPLEVTVTADLDTGGTFTGSATADGTYEIRVYLEERPESEITVTVAAGSSSVSGTHVIPRQKDRGFVLWPYVLVMVLVLMLVLTWKAFSTD